MKIYTKSGDKGETGILTGARVPKDAIYLEAVGALDECNSALGCALVYFEASELESLKGRLATVQETLFEIGAALATPLSQLKEGAETFIRWDYAEATQSLEQWIDEMTDALPELKNFILPGGHQAAAFLHLARSISRRAERIAVSLYKQKDISNDVVVYLNRLSDFLFTASRYVNQTLGVNESIWKT